MLGINHQTLTKYRNHGLIAYSRVGDKFWYSQQDIEDFLTNNHQNPIY